MNHIERIVKLKDIQSRVEHNLNELKLAQSRPPLARKEVWLFWKETEIEAAKEDAELALVRINRLMHRASNVLLTQLGE